jgi:hypothetical protein
VFKTTKHKYKTANAPLIIANASGSNSVVIVFILEYIAKNIKKNCHLFQITTK